MEPKGRKARDELVRRYVEATGAARNLHLVLDQFVASILRNTNPEDVCNVAVAIKRCRLKWEQQLLESTLALCLNYYDTTTLEAVTAFLESEVGQRFAAAQPALIASGADMGQSLGQEWYEDVREALDDMGHRVGGGRSQ